MKLFSEILQNFTRQYHQAQTTSFEECILDTRLSAPYSNFGQQHYDEEQHAGPSEVLVDVVVLVALLVVLDGNVLLASGGDRMVPTSHSGRHPQKGCETCWHVG